MAPSVGGALPVALAAAVALGLAACGGDDSPTATTAGSGQGTVTIYSSLAGRTPAQRASVAKAIDLAFDQAGGRAGRFRVRHRSLAVAAMAGRAGQARVARNAREAARDDSSVGYIGELGGEASAVSIPILNAAGLAQVSPGETAVGLTVDEPGAGTDEPDRFYPAGTRTFVRVIPRDSLEAGALVARMRTDGCTRVAVAGATARNAAALASAMADRDAGRGPRLLRARDLAGLSADEQAVADAFGRQNADCFVYAGGPSREAGRLYRAVVRALPVTVGLYGTHRLCVPSFVARGPNGIGEEVAGSFTCTRPVLPPRRYPGGPSFVDAYEAEYASAPDPYAIYGYEAARLLLRAVATAGRRGDDRAAVLAALRATKEDPKSVLGRYSIGESGDTSLATYGAYGVSSRGALRFDARVLATSR